MKKILGILLTAVMLCTSMGVLAAEEEVTPVTLPASYGFEDSETSLFTFGDKLATATNKITVVGEENGIKPYSGSKMLKSVSVDNTTTSLPMKIRDMNLNPGTRYKITFRYYSPVARAPYVEFRFGTMYLRNVNRNILQASQANTWTTYTVFVEKSTLTDDYFTIISRGAGITEYYDAVEVEEVPGAGISFIEGTVNTATNAQINTMDAAARTSYFNPIMNYAIGNAKVYLYTSWIVGKECTSLNGDVNVATQYNPKAIGEKTILMVGIYKDINGVPVLQKVVTKDYTYGKTAIAAGAVIAADHPAHDRLDVAANVLTIKASDYSEGCYLKAFMISNLSDLTSISTAATLPAAAAATPAA